MHILKVKRYLEHFCSFLHILQFYYLLLRSKIKSCQPLVVLSSHFPHIQVPVITFLSLVRAKNMTDTQISYG